MAFTVLASESGVTDILLIPDFKNNCAKTFSGRCIFSADLRKVVHTHYNEVVNKQGFFQQAFILGHFKLQLNFIRALNLNFKLHCCEVL